MNASHIQTQIRPLTRGAGLSYNDSCQNNYSHIINTQRLNHLISFDEQTGILICQPGITFKDMFLVNTQYIPPVLPGSVHATIAGGIAHDVHGKNNHHAGSLGHHILWLDLLIADKTWHCSPEENPELFHATIAGAGLTGLIKRVAIRLKKASGFVKVETKALDSIDTLIDTMLGIGLHYDYQVAWLDLLHTKPRALLSLARHCEPIAKKQKNRYSIPPLPCSLVYLWNMKLLNQLYFISKKTKQKLSLQEFNNPLDKIKHWNRLYGPKGFLQFQAVFEQDKANETIEHLLKLIKSHKATPTLAVLKLFTQTGIGLLSFCKPGFTLAIDFINNAQARQAIMMMNEYISEVNGHIYLAKDLLLNPQQYNKMYKNHEQFVHILQKYQCTMESDLAKRLGILPTSRIKA